MICPNCERNYTPDLLAREDYDGKFAAWRFEGHLIQDVWPDATPIQREQLQTGICSDRCWDEYLGG